MGRRSSHSPGELRHIILQSARKLVEDSGLSALSARAIAKDIGYSPGTLYNVFNNLDDLLLSIQAALIEEALEEMNAIPAGSNGSADLRALSDAYISFALKNRELWTLLLQHVPKPGATSSEVVDRNHNAIIELLESAIKPIMREHDETSVRRFAKAIWASVHGISVIAVAEKASVLPIDDARPSVALVVDSFLHKLSDRASALAVPSTSDGPPKDFDV